MCGINGFNFRDKKLISLMNKTLSHRGPDDSGVFLRKNISFGHQRLAIIDLSKKGAQPMRFLWKEKNYYITFNGEIYNFQEIRETLLQLGYKFTSNSDTEVIMAAYDNWGEKCLEKFNGMWAFAIYDELKKELFLSRDRFGKKPLYYYNKDNKFVFSSEIKSLLQFGMKREVNKEALREIFTYRFTFGDNTILKNIKSFNQGHYMIFDLNKNKIREYKKYYSLKISKEKKSFSTSLVELSSLLDDSVRQRVLSSDVPVASLLSGGIDSSLITYYAKKYNKNLHTFSIGFDTTNELPYAKIVADSLKTQHHEFKVNKDQVLNYLEDMVYHMDEPIGADPGFLPIFILSKEVSKYNKVVLSGDGADEVFIGYDRYKLFYYGLNLSRFTFKIPLKNQIFKRLQAMKGKSESESFVEITRVFEKEELERLGIKEKYVTGPIWISSYSSLTKAQIYDIQNLLPKDFFMKSDKMSSAYGLEQRTPFMDYRLVEFGLSLPILHKLRGWNEKYILRELAKKKLPKEIWKRRKHGFNVPIDYWFKTSLGEELTKLLKKNKHELYNKDYVYELLAKLKISKEGFKSRNIIAQKLWTILIFEVWYDIYIVGNK